MGKVFLPIVMLAAQTTNELPITEVSGMAKSIDEYGIMVVMCAVLLMFTLILFRSTIRRANRDEVIIKMISDLANTINNIKNSDVDIAGSFDKHNTKLVLESEHIKSLLQTVEEKLASVDKDEQDGINEIKGILASIDQECSKIGDYAVKTDIAVEEVRKDVKELAYRNSE